MIQNLQQQEPDIYEVADLLSDVTSTLMTSGAHAMRILQNVSRMAKTFGYRMDLSVFHLSIIMTITHLEDPCRRLTLIKKNAPSLLNFNMVSKLSAMSWETFDKKRSFNEAKDIYQQIILKERMSPWLVLFLVSCGNAAFCGLFHGDAYAIGLVFLATLAGFSVRQTMIKRHINQLVVFTTSAFVASLFAGMAYVFHLGVTPEIALASSVLYLIPGVPLINSILDIVQGHILIGTARLVNAFSLIVCVAIGLFASMLILGLEKL